MDSFQTKKNEYLREISKLVLSRGIAYCSLKKMAETAATSDRMLMHYFKDKNEILTLALKNISQDMLLLLSRSPVGELNYKELVLFLKESIRSSTIKPYLDLWFELIYLASGNKEPYHSIAREIGDSYWNWIIKIYTPTCNEDKESMAALLFTLTEGIVMLDKMGMSDKGDSAVNTILNTL